MTLVPELRDALAAEGKDDMMVIIGGVIPPQDFDALRDAGAPVPCAEGLCTRRHHHGRTHSNCHGCRKATLAEHALATGQQALDAFGTGPGPQSSL